MSYCEGNSGVKMILSEHVTGVYIDVFCIHYTIHVDPLTLIEHYMIIFDTPDFYAVFITPIEHQVFDNPPPQE